MMQKIVFTCKRWNSENGRNKKKSPDMVIRSDNAPIYKELLEGRTKATNRKKLVAFVLSIIRKEKLPMSEELEKLRHKQ